MKNNRRDFFKQLAGKGIETKSKHKWVMLVDLRKCIGCQSCTVACKHENRAPVGEFRTIVSEVEIGQYPRCHTAFLPRLCNHCDRPSCVDVCPAGATWKRKEDGIVVVDYDACIGCGSCVEACPYDARFINKETDTVDKCNFCLQRLEQHLKPACVETCVGEARMFGDLNNSSDPVTQIIKKGNVSVLKPSTGNDPSVYYIDLPKELQNSSKGKSTNWANDFNSVFGKKGDKKDWVNKDF